MPKIEYVTVADHAEAINGKLYLFGAGWTDITPPPGPQGQLGIVHIGIAVSILVGWNETNRRFPLEMTVAHEDGEELAKINAQIEAGRPAGMTPGADLRNVMALGANLTFPKLGSYEVRAQLGEEVRSVTFRVRGQDVGPGGIQLPPTPHVRS